MRFRVLRDMTFRHGTGRIVGISEVAEEHVLPAGEVVEEAAYATFPEELTKSYRERARRLAAEHGPAARLVMFVWRGQERYGVVGVDVAYADAAPRQGSGHGIRRVARPLV